MKAGKGLDERVAEVRIRFKLRSCNALHGTCTTHRNELVARIQPDESLYLKTNTKLPGLTARVVPTVMDMTYAGEFKDAYIADAYERMFLNAAKGDASLFVSGAEIAEAWRIFTPMLHAIDATKPKPVVYPFGTRNPTGFRAWSQKFANIRQHHAFLERIAWRAENPHKLEELFKKFDSNGNGILENAELRALAKELYDGRDCPDATMKKLLRMHTTTRDDQISFEEFKAQAILALEDFGNGDD